MSAGRARATAHDPYRIGALQAELDAAIAERNRDLLALAADGIAHAVIAETMGVTRSYVSRLVRDHNSAAWGTPVPVERETYAARLTRARQEWEAIRDAAEEHAMREGAGADRREETRALKGSDKVAARDVLAMSVPTWREFQRTASLSWQHEQSA